MKEILLNPGPTNTRGITKVRQWAGSDVCHRTEKFQKILTSLKFSLLNRFGSKDFNIAVLAGSGTAALDSMISSLGVDGMTFIDAGSYGSRACDIATTYGISHNRVISKTIEDLTFDERSELVYFVENETSTGEKYSIETMSKIFPNAKFIIDSTSSFGATNYHGYHDKILAISFCSNKCLQSTPGVSAVIWHPSQKVNKRSYYGFLEMYTDNMPFTLPVQVVYSLEETMKHNKNNESIFDKRMTTLIDAFFKLGINCINKNPSNSVAAFKHPNMSYDELSSFLIKRKIVIYSGVPGIENSFRVSTMSVDFDRKFKKILGAFSDSCIH